MSEVPQSSSMPTKLFDLYGSWDGAPGAKLKQSMSGKLWALIQADCVDRDAAVTLARGLKKTNECKDGNCGKRATNRRDYWILEKTV